MRKLKIISLMIVFGLAIIACKPSKDKAIEKISLLENELLSQTAKIDSAKAQQLVSLYVSYADQFKTDSISPFYLFKAADILMNISDYEKSIALIDRVVKDYPEFQRVPDCIFFKAFIFENMIGDLKKAEEIYKDFLIKYPDHDMASSAKAAIENLGIPAEDLIKNFEEKNKASKDTIKA